MGVSPLFNLSTDAEAELHSWSGPVYRCEERTMHRSAAGFHSSASISERKFAEKLTILNERGQGILTRVYNIKKVVSLEWQIESTEVLKDMIMGWEYTKCIVLDTSVPARRVRTKPCPRVCWVLEWCHQCWWGRDTTPANLCFKFYWW